MQWNPVQLLKEFSSTVDTEPETCDKEPETCDKEPETCDTEAKIVIK